MTTSRSRIGSKSAQGLSAAQRAMWDRLYSAAAHRHIPRTTQGPFPPLVRAVEDGWLTPPGPILDVGCGVGTNTYWLASRGFRATGIDVASGAIEAAESARATGRHNPVFLVDDVLVTRLPASRFRAAVDVGCFHTLPPRTRRAFATSLSRILAPGARYLLFWVAREETGPWGPPHRLSVREVTDAFETSFRVDRIVHRPRVVRLTSRLKKSARPLATLSGYSAVLVRRNEPQPPAL